MTDDEKLAMVDDHEEWLWVRWQAILQPGAVMGVKMPSTTTECLEAIELCQRIRATIQNEVGQ